MEQPDYLSVREFIEKTPKLHKPRNKIKTF